MSKKLPLEWNLKQLYKSANDPKIEKDIAEIEQIQSDFAKRFDVEEKPYLTNKDELLVALTEYDLMLVKLSQCKPLLYFFSYRDTDSQDTEITSKLNLYSDRINNSHNKIIFFKNSLGHIVESLQKEILTDTRFSKYKYFLTRVFEYKHRLSVPEEKIMSLKSLPAYDMWVDMNKKALGRATVKWNGKEIPLSQASNIVLQLDKASDRAKLAKIIIVARKEVAVFSESEINAVITNKKINDSLRNFVEPYDSTVIKYANKPETVVNLVKEVTESYKISHEFYRLKAKILKMPKLNYWDRAASFGKINKKFTFGESVDLLKKIFDELNPLYAKKLEDYVANGQVDVYPKQGKVGGAYCRGSYIEPSFVLLNHTDDFKSFKTFAHEMGHAFHTILSRKQEPMYFEYSTAMAEVASTLFESIAFEAVFDSLSQKEKIYALHDRISGDVSTIFRQIACFQYELDIHKTIRSKGYLSKEELALMHNKHMSKYLGSAVRLIPDDGYLFVDWSHLRRFFYVYSYAFGLLVSKALFRRYKADKSYWKEIEKFLSAGGKDTPENILLEIGIDVSKKDFWQEGLAEIKSDIDLLKKLQK